MEFHLRDKFLGAFTILTILISTLYYYTVDINDPGRCKALLQDGFWLDPANLRNWQPASCMLHNYRNNEASTCLRDRRVTFIGGTTTRHLFEAVTRKLDPQYVPVTLGRETNSFISIASVRMQFIWDPELQSEELKQIQSSFTDDHALPALTVVGLGHDYLRQQTDVTNWAARIGALVSGFGGDMSRRARQSDAVVLAPVIEPNLTVLPERDAIALSPARVNAMNEALWRLSDQYDVHTAFAFNKIARASGALADGLRPSQPASDAMADILLNFRCNEKLPKHYPYASTCCNQYPRPSWVQLAGFVFLAVLVPCATFLAIGVYVPAMSQVARKLLPPSKYHAPLITMGLAVLLCWYCDRTNILGKEQKQTIPSQFLVGMVLIILASLFTLKTADKDLAFLNRDQTDEWKGWMQVAILVYHYVGVSKTAYIYNYMRVCPTSYLFMTGFGHTVYFLKKDDFSFKRVTATMLRLNLLNVILAYAMGNDWLLYYFAPLVTWNFFVIFFCLYVGHDKNKNLPFLFGKMAIAAALNTAFYRVPGVLETFWSVLQLAFRMQGDLREWRFRITLDQYSIFPGMICAVLFINWNNMSLPKSSAWPFVSRLIYLISIIIMLGYAYFEATQPSKQIYNQKHTYVSWLPCCAFVILRNSTPWLRKTHNRFFAWVGSGSLETFLLQFHIWLGADTAGLINIPGLGHERFLTFLIMTPIFFWVSALVTNSTGAVIEWIMLIEKKGPALPTVAPTPKANGNLDEKSDSPHINGKLVAFKDVELKEMEREASPTGLKIDSVWDLVSKAQTDLRLRVLLILAGMAIMNWTYDIY